MPFEDIWSLGWSLPPANSHLLLLHQLNHTISLSRVFIYYDKRTWATWANRQIVLINVSNWKCAWRHAFSLSHPSSPIPSSLFIVERGTATAGPVDVVKWKADKISRVVFYTHTASMWKIFWNPMTEILTEWNDVEKMFSLMTRERRRMDNVENLKNPRLLSILSKKKPGNESTKLQ